MNTDAISSGLKRKRGSRRRSREWGQLKCAR